MREPYKDIELSERKWRINKFDALTGSQLLRKFMAAREADPQTFVGTLSDEDFAVIQSACLRSCGEITEVAGNAVSLPVLNASGSWGVANLQNDTVTVYMLTIACVSFNLSSFFDASVLKGLEKIAMDFSPSNAQI
jgi:hypothetical protein